MKQYNIFILLLLGAFLLSSCINRGDSSEHISVFENTDNSDLMNTTSDTSSPVFDHPPFEAINRTALLADSMPAICDPLVKGDFIQAWYCSNWNEREWMMYFKILEKAGLDFIILQSTSDRKEGKYTHFYYPSAMADDKEISANNVSVKTGTVKNMLEAASKSGFKVYIGIGGDEKWWSYSFKNISWCKKEAELANQCAKELYELYKKDYPDTFIGWYWTWEMFAAKDRYEVNWSKMLNFTLDYLTELDPTMPVMISPFYSSYEEPTIERVREQWSYLTTNTNFRKGDIFCPQDNIGIHSKEYGDESMGAKYSVEFMEQVIIAQWEAAKENKNLRFWLNVENFNNGKTTSITRYIDQLDIASKYAEKLITFSYAHYYSPLRVDPRYNKEYLLYKSWIESQKE